MRCASGTYKLEKRDFSTERDKKERLQYRKMGRLERDHPHFWTDDVAFYLDGVCFVHKSNPIPKVLKIAGEKGFTLWLQ